MSNQHRIKNLLLNNDRGVYMAGQIDHYVLSSLPLAGVDNLAEVLDISYWKNKVQTMSTTDSNGWTGYIQKLGTTGTTNPDTDTQWINAVNAINNNVVWIWGSLEGGGFGIYKRPSDTSVYGVICVSGYYFNGTDRYRYWMNTSQNHIPNAVDEICVAYQYAGYPTATNDTGSYGLITIGLLNPTQGYITSWNMVSDGSANINYIVDQLHPIENTDIVSALSGSDVTVKKSVLADYYVFIKPFKYNQTNGMFNGIVGFNDDENTELTGYVRIQGHWYGEEVKKDKNDGDGGNGGGGGGGSYNPTSKPKPPVPFDQLTTDVLGTGFVTIYNPTSAQLLSLAQYLFSGITTNVANMLKKLMANPMDYIISLNMCHFNLTCNSATSVKFGGVDTGVTMPVVDKQYCILDGGSVYIEPYHASFLDYSPYAKAKIFIPYVGMHELPIDQIRGRTISIRFIVDCLTGAMVCELCLSGSRDLRGTETIVYEGTDQDKGFFASYSGNCFTPMPISSTDYRNTLNSILGLASGLGTTIATGNPLPVAGAVANGVMNCKPTLQVGGDIASNYGHMSQLEPFIVIEETVQNRPYEFQHWMGYPSNFLKKVSYFKNSLIIIEQGTFWSGDTDNHFTSITDAEKDELSQIMDSGIFVGYYD